jgi:hypothetical protein
MDNRKLAVEIAMDSYARVRFGAEGDIRQWKDLNEDSAPIVFAEMIADLALGHMEVALLKEKEGWDIDEDHMEGEKGDFALDTLKDEYTLSDWYHADKLLPSYMCRFLSDQELKKFADDCDEEDHFEYLLKKREELLCLFRHSRRVAILTRKLLDGEKVEQELNACLAKSGY